MGNDKWNGLKKDSHLLSKVNNQIEEKKRLKTQTNANKRNENEKDIEVAK